MLRASSLYCSSIDMPQDKTEECCNCPCCWLVKSLPVIPRFLLCSRWHLIVDPATQGERERERERERREREGRAPRWTSIETKAPADSDEDDISSCETCHDVMCCVQHGPPHMMSTLTVSCASDGSANLTATSRPSTEPLKPSNERSLLLQLSLVFPVTPHWSAGPLKSMHVIIWWPGSVQSGSQYQWVMLYNMTYSSVADFRAQWSDYDDYVVVVNFCICKGNGLSQWMCILLMMRLNISDSLMLSWWSCTYGKFRLLGGLTWMCTRSKLVLSLGRPVRASMWNSQEL